MFITRRDLNENRDPTGIKFPAGNINARNKGSAQQKEVPRSHGQVEAGGGRSQGPAQLRVREKNAQDIKKLLLVK